MLSINYLTHVRACIQGEFTARTFKNNWTSSLNPHMTKEDLLRICTIHTQEAVEVDVLQLQHYTLGRTLKQHQIHMYLDSLRVSRTFHYALSSTTNVQKNPGHKDCPLLVISDVDGRLTVRNGNHRVAAIRSMPQDERVKHQFQRAYILHPATPPWVGSRIIDGM